tara:strand:+ start:396 stop:704 length:309 start_codon:yes stop_codon:yes gene_type:complete
LRFAILFTKVADEHLTKLEQDTSKKKIFKAVCKTLAFMEVNLRHPSLQTHKFHTLSGSQGQEVFESYAQQHTPGAYRIFWYYGPAKSQITIVAIVPHPNIKK